GPHAFVFAYRYSAGEDEPFGAATDGAEQRTDLDLASLGRINGLLAQLGSAGRHIPERFALHLGSCLSFLRKISGGSGFHASTLHAFYRIGLDPTPLYCQTRP